MTIYGYDKGCWLFITSDFVYIHVPKTGGTFVRTALRRLCNATHRDYLDTATPEGRARLRAQGQHGTAREIPKAHRGKPVLFGVRNPFDYYVSLFEFGWWRRCPEDEFDERRISERFPSYPHLSFSAFIEATNDWHLWPESSNEDGRSMEERAIGLLTWKLITMLSLDPGAVFSEFDAFAQRPFNSALFPELSALRTHRLADDLIDFLGSCGLASEDTAFIKGLGHIYPAEGGRDLGNDWRTYYDSTLLSFVRSAERVVFAHWPEFEAQNPPSYRA